jgi:hypothetical protein
VIFNLSAQQLHVIAASMNSAKAAIDGVLADMQAQANSQPAQPPTEPPAPPTSSSSAST